MGKAEKTERDEVALAARASTRKVDGLTRALPAWLEPIKKKLIEARKAGATLAELREQMLEWHPNTQALAEALAGNVEAGLRGEQSEEIEAQCNQHEHDAGCDNAKQNLTKIVFQNTVKTRNEAKELLKNKGYIGKTISNKKNKKLSTKISGEGLRKLTDSHITKKNLVPLGFSIKEAEEIHMTAVANLPELFEKAEDIDIQPAYHGNGRKSVTHLRAPFSVQSSNNDFVADMSLIQYVDKNNGDKLYALHVEIGSPDGLREAD